MSQRHAAQPATAAPDELLVADAPSVQNQIPVREEPVVPEPIVPAREPEIDPLLLGPPLFAEQNRPLDAPRFTRRSRPVEQEPPGAARQDPPQAPGQDFALSGLPDVFGNPDVQTVPDEPPGLKAQAVPDHPTEPPGLKAQAVPDHPAEPPGPKAQAVPDPPAEPHRRGPASPPSVRPALRPPQMGQLNRGLTPGTDHPAKDHPAKDHPAAGQTAAERPVTERGKQTTTARQARPPLQPPQLGQLNRPVEPAGRRPVGNEPTGPGLPGRPARVANVEMIAEDPPIEDQIAPWAVGQDDSAAPSGLLSPPPARPGSPVAGESADDEAVPSGLPHRTDLP